MEGEPAENMAISSNNLALMLAPHSGLDAAQQSEMSSAIGKYGAEAGLQVALRLLAHTFHCNPNSDVINIAFIGAKREVPPEGMGKEDYEFILALIHDVALEIGKSNPLSGMF
jgi:hypothetical protein